jgi:rod shape-determining protein MreD
MALVAISQVTITTHIRILGVSPDLVLLCTMSWVLLQGMREGVLVALAGGIVLDALSGAPFGGMTLALLVVSCLGGLGEINVFRTARFLPYAAIGIATLVYAGVLLFWLAMNGHAVVWGATLWRVVLPEMVVNILCMPIIYGLIRWLCGRIYPQPVEWQ